MRRLLVIAGLLGVAAACDAGPWDEATLVDELRVATVVASPPEVVPGDTIDLEVHLMDPFDAPRDLLVWFCTPWAGTCIEAGPPDRALPLWSAVREDAALVERVRFEIPEAADQVLMGDGARHGIVQWTLACRPGLCPIIDAVSAAPAPDTEGWRGAVEQLSLPGSWLRDVPLDGVALSVRTLALSNLAAVDRNRNPTLERVDDQPLEVRPGGSLDLVFRAGEGVVYPMASAGAFTERDAPGRREVLLTWVAPETPGRVDLLVAIEDGTGGAGVWRDVAVVR